MADICDIAGDASDKLEAARVAAVRRAAGRRELQPQGVCYWCDEYAAGDHLFCDSECAADWERAAAARRRAGTR